MSTAQQFRQHMEKVLIAISDAGDALDRMMTNENLLNLVDESNKLGGRVTVMEPAVLLVETQRLMRTIKDLELIAEIQTHDPKRERVGETGTNWYSMIKGQRPTVAAIKELRSAFKNTLGHSMFELRDAKRILELVEQGLI